MSQQQQQNKAHLEVNLKVPKNIKIEAKWNIGHNNHNKTKHSSSKLQISTSIKIDAKGNIGHNKTKHF